MSKWHFFVILPFVHTHSHTSALFTTMYTQFMKNNLTYIYKSVLYVVVHLLFLYMYVYVFLCISIYLFLYFIKWWLVIVLLTLFWLCMCILLYFPICSLHFISKYIQRCWKLESNTLYVVTYMADSMFWLFYVKGKINTIKAKWGKKKKKRRTTKILIQQHHIAAYHHLLSFKHKR